MGIETTPDGRRFFVRWDFLPAATGTASGEEVNHMTSVNLRPNESQEQLFKRFKKKVMRSGLLSQLRNKRWFVSKSEVRRIEKKKAIRRINKRKRRDSED
jgi:small subunit ribosomal protein S21